MSPRRYRAGPVASVRWRTHQPAPGAGVDCNFALTGDDGVIGLASVLGGCIEVLDRALLEAHVCECYGVVKREYERLVPGRLGALHRHARERLQASC